jgi:hypothetical protein
MKSTIFLKILHPVGTLGVHVSTSITYIKEHPSEMQQPSKASREIRTFRPLKNKNKIRERKRVSDERNPRFWEEKAQTEHGQFGLGVYM